MIELRHISKNFGDQTVLQDINATIGDGETWCVIGQSGGGKSVLLKVMTGLLIPDQGDLIFDGVSSGGNSEKQWSEVLRQVGVVFQGSALFSSLSVFENVGLRLLEEKQLKLPEIQDRVKTALKDVGLKPEEILGKFPHELSGGMQKRVAVARAIVHRPKWVFYDEPTTGLDPISSARIDELMHSLSKEPGRTSIIITHDLFTVKSIASHVLFLHDGKVRFIGKPVDFFASTDPEVQQFLSRKF